jgi:hypothetical protein
MPSREVIANKMFFAPSKVSALKKIKLIKTAKSVRLLPKNKPIAE